MNVLSKVYLDFLRISKGNNGTGGTLVIILRQEETPFKVHFCVV